MNERDIRNARNDSPDAPRGGILGGLHAEPQSLETLTPAGKNELEQWLSLLVQWNARIDLTAAKGEVETSDLMLADAAILSARVPQNARVVDIGSGAGAPGLPLAFLRRDLDVTLVEPLTKRIAFLRTVLGTVGRSDIHLERARGDQLRGTWDVAISRATLAPAAWVALATKLVVPGGSIWVLLAKEEPPALGDLDLTMTEEIPYTWPGTGVSRRAVRYVKAP